MKKYTIINPGVNSISAINIFKRNTSVTKGVLINTTHFEISNWATRTFPTDYNNSLLYFKDRKVDILPESTSANTIITNDGLIGVLYFDVTGNVYVLTVTDIFESENISYGNITPTDKDILGTYTLANNPLAIRTIYCQINGSGLVTTNNYLQFIDSTGGYHFFSMLDYNELQVDEYGYFITDETNWNSTYKTTSNFGFLKKPFLKFSTDKLMTLTLTMLSEDSTLELTNLNDGYYGLKYLDIHITEAAKTDSSSDILDKVVNFNINSNLTNTNFLLTVV